MTVWSMLLKKETEGAVLTVGKYRTLKASAMYEVFKMKKKKLQAEGVLLVFKASVISLVLFIEQSLRKIFSANKPEVGL